MRSKKRVLLLFAGGTISMHKNENTGALDIEHGADQFFHLEPRLIELAEIDVMFVDNIDSTNCTHEHWERFIDRIHENYADYDGFLITMGTNTLAYAASALSFAIEQIGKPVVLTGAQIPAEIISTDGRNNLVNALRVCTLDLSGVFVVFGSKIILGCRSKKASESDLDAFKTFNASDFGQIAVGIKLFGIADKHKRDDRLRIVVKNGFRDKIVCLTMIPGFPPGTIRGLIDAGIEGVIIRAYGAGDIPYSLLPELEYARDKRIPIVATTQCPGGATIMGMNDVGLKSVEVGVIQAFDMSMESMSTKLMWALKQGVAYEDMKVLMECNLRGEVDNRMAHIILNQEVITVPSERS